MRLQNGLFFIFLFSALSLFAMQQERSSTNLSYTRLTNGLHEPEFEGGRTDFVMVDINGNGHVDIISIGDHGSPFVNTDQHGIMVWFNDGSGNFSLHMDGNFGYGGISAGDINNNGLMDLAFGMHHPYSGGDLGSKLIEVAAGDGTGTNWSAWSDGLATNGETWGMFGTDLGDVNNNGWLDLVSISFGCCAGHHVYLNQGDGSWVPVYGDTGGNSDNLVQFADLNNNGILDYVAGHSEGTAFFGDGEGNFVNNDNGLPVTDEFSYFYGISVGDINNDGSDEIAFTTVEGAIKVFAFDAEDEVWVDYSGSLPSAGFRMTQLFDMNANGYTDLVAFGNGTIQLFLGDGQGGWTPDAVFYTDESPGNARALRAGGDLTQNGHGDIVLLSFEGDGWWWDRKNELYVFAEESEADALWIKNLYPKGNETFYPGAVRFIEWASAVPGNVPSQVKIEISPNGADGPWTLVADELPNNGRYQWTVPDYASENCHLRLTVHSDDGEAVEVTDVPFRILGESTPGSHLLTFNIGDEHGNPVDDATVIIDGVEQPVGEHVFELEAGTYNWAVVAGCLHEASGEVTLLEDETVEVVMLNIPGDANGDGMVNVLDVVSIVNHYLGLQPDPFCLNNADVNLDGVVDVLDIIETVGIFVD